MTENKRAFYSQVKQLGILTTIPIILLTGPAVGFWAGGWIDKKWNIYPWCTAILTLMGFMASGKEVARLLKEALRESDKSKGPDSQ